MLQCLQHPETRQTSLSIMETTECQIFKGNSGTYIEAIFPDMPSYHSTWRSFENFAQSSREEKGVKEERRLREGALKAESKAFSFLFWEPARTNAKQMAHQQRSAREAQLDEQPGRAWNQGWDSGFWAEERNKTSSLQATSGLSSRRTQNTAWQAEGQRSQQGQCGNSELS